jgi:hypothetical protein
MDRDESISLLLKCEKARGEALAAGKTNNEAHDAAKVMERLGGEAAWPCAIC